MSHKYKASDELRRWVRTGAAAGMTEPQLAELANCSDRTLRKVFKHELHHGHKLANIEVVANLYAMATGADKRIALSAAIFWCKTRLGWRETDPINVAANANAQAGVVLRLPMPIDDVDTYNKLAAEQQARSMEASRMMSDNVAAGGPVLRAVPRHHGYPKSADDGQQVLNLDHSGEAPDREADCIYAAGTIRRNPLKRRTGATKEPLNIQRFRTNL